MNILLINTPSRRGIGGFMIPLGLLYVGSIIERCGHNAKIIDPYLYDVELRDFDSGKFDGINKVIEEYTPSIIGYGGIATSYGRVKKISQFIRENHPDIFQIAGGPLASTYDLLLTCADIDIVFHAETEVSLPVFLKKYAQKEDIYQVPGISYLSSDKEIITNPLPEQIKNLDSIPLPAYNLIDVSRYLHSIKYWLDSYRPLLNNTYSMSSIIDTIGNKTNYFPINTTRGCTHKCIFCYRHMRGIRQYSPGYVVNHVKYLKKHYGIEGFQFVDELFNSDPEWVLELCDLIEKEKLNIFYLVGGARVDRIDEKILYRLKETGCIEINYGHESGSDTILKEYRKGVSVQKNKEVTVLTKRVGISCPVQIVIGSPSETNETIDETIQFLKSLDAYLYALNYLIPLPETPIWQYVKKHQLIADVENYLDLAAEYGGLPVINLTRMPDKVWRDWSLRIRRSLNLHFYKNTDKKKYYIYKILYVISDEIRFFLPPRITKYIPQRVKSLFWELKA